MARSDVSPNHLSSSLSTHSDFLPDESFANSHFTGAAAESSSEKRQKTAYPHVNSDKHILQRKVSESYNELHRLLKLGQFDASAEMYSLKNMMRRDNKTTIIQMKERIKAMVESEAAKVNTSVKNEEEWLQKIDESKRSRARGKHIIETLKAAFAQLKLFERQCFQHYNPELNPDDYLLHVRGPVP